MYSYGPTKYFLSAILAIGLLLSPGFIVVAAAESEPPCGPSGCGETFTPSYSGPVTASGDTYGAIGGVDVALGGTREPSIAVNPTNRNNIAAADLFSIRVSTDNGVNFTAATPPPVPAGFGLSGDPSIAFDSQGRLFWTYLGSRNDNGNLDVFISQVNPATGAILAGYPVNVTAGAGFPASGAANNNDKEWLAADRFVGSAFQDRLYVVWTRFTGGTPGTVMHTTFSADQGQNWSAALTVSAGGENFVWPSHNAVAVNGDVYVSYHSQPTFVSNAPDGTSGQVFVLRSTDGGVSYPQKNTAYTAGNADITFNVQTAGNARILNQSATWTQGSAQAWILPDPVNANNVYVVAADDPTNTQHGGAVDDMDIFIVRSTNNGNNWSAPTQVDAGANGTTQFFPTAGMDDQTGCLSVMWYDTRNAAVNAGGNFLLDVFLRNSSDGGLTFGPEVQINDVAFDPDLGAGARFNGPPPTLRIGEYNGVAVDDIAHSVWAGNTATAQQVIYDNNPTCRCGVNVDNYDEACGDDGVDIPDELSRDIDMVTVTSDGCKITVTVLLCAAPDNKAKYRLHLDYKDSSGDKGPDLLSPDFTCATTSDDTIKLFKGDKTKGPGTVGVAGNTLTFEVFYADLAVNQVPGNLASGDVVYIWVDTQYRGIQDRAPSTDGTDNCSKPQNCVEVVRHTLNSGTCP